jgi:hypothetical protein
LPAAGFDATCPYSAACAITWDSTSTVLFTLSFDSLPPAAFDRA